MNFLTLCVLWSSAVCGLLAQNETEGFIQEAVRSLLGVKDGTETSGNSSRRLPEPPKYMLDLYDTYKKGEVPTQGNTVRSILPMQGKVEDFQILVFNLTGIHSEEEILQGWLHIFKRRQPKGSRRRASNSYRLKISDLGSSLETYFIDILPSKKAGWFSYNVTEIVLKSRSVQKDEDYLLGVTAETQRHNGKYRTISLRRIVRLSSQPFLIIFSEDKSSHLMKEENNFETNDEDLGMNVFQGSGNLDSLPSHDDILSSRSKRSIVTKSILYDDITMNPISRTKRSILSNDVPDDTLANRKLTKKKQVTIKYSKKIDPDIIPLPHKTKGRPFNRRQKRRKGKQPPFWWLKDKAKYGGHNPEQMCQKKKMQVEFANIGWSEYVISPNFYDASYCSGKCDFPLVESDNPSNHAIIQSFVHTLGRNTVIPLPCCVPASTSSISLLYVDKNKNVVLKTYPNMVVKSCGCK